MPVTIHVNGTSNSLVHKGSSGIAKSTLPDVCKTPSPGGPVPIPYPIIVSMSSDLKKGTKTVKVDGKKMAAIKGSEFSRCTGDEPGTAGGVKSSTNMKEATWILYSFDVKMEGKNACRLSDMMQMNHGNTVCLNGEMQEPVIGPGVITLTCRDDWTPCQKKQMKAKAARMDEAAKAKPGGLTTRSTAGQVRDAADSWAAKFRRDWDKTSPEGWPDFADPSKQENQFFDDCAKTSDPKGAKMQADHALEVQLGGHVKGPFIWLDRSVNASSGSQICQQIESGSIDKVVAVQTENC